ncbi:hypothetical protein KLP40_11815 [Hymenobacter sp. NST-14]|uniref:hypothetical protein n=1 Tax=Hymenobacter piscis TaxID=2839984 RepID=UPI001C02AFCD|nr:hypothetical protein [Hymenobacter piscis]MBT9393850.1 hypothetical protein [Hymenobacter piscis]
MRLLLPTLLLLATACTTAPPDSTTAPAAIPASQPLNEARAAERAARYFRSQPDSAVYLLPTLRVLDAGTSWQALVKRSDRVGVMPDNAAIDIDKQTGAISPVRVK